MSERHFLWNFFDPRSVVIVGARSTPGFGFALPIWLKEHGHGEKVSLVNPRGGTLHGYEVYKSIEDVGRPVDLAVVITPAPAVPGVLEEIARAGIRNVVIESAGFAETGEEGRALQRKCRRIAVENNLKVLGPNCVGVVSTENRFATCEIIDEALKPGGIGLVAQSGVFGNILLDIFPGKGLSISRTVTLGNRLVVDESDVLDFYRDDPMTRVVVMYLEGAADGAKLKGALERITPVKPVIALKSGRTDEGVAAAASHTGSLAGRDAIYDSLFAQTGAIRAYDVANMLDLATAFVDQPLPASNRICVLTSSGSMGAVSIDTAVKGGLVAARLSDETLEKVRRQAPAWMNVRNPLDVGPSGIFTAAFEAVMDDPGVDMVLIILTIPYAVIERFGDVGINAGAWLGPLKEIRERAPEKPVVAATMGHPDWRRQIMGICSESIAVVEFPENGARALAAMARYARFRKALSY